MSRRPWKRGSRGQRRLNRNGSPERIARAAGEQNWRCCYCGGRMTNEQGWTNSATLDHVIPRHQGGPNAFENLVAACARCNVRRGNTDAQAFFERVQAEGWQPCDVRPRPLSRKVNPPSLRRPLYRPFATLADVWPDSHSKRSNRDDDPLDCRR